MQYLRTILLKRKREEMSQTIGVADHAASSSSFGEKVKNFLATARKAVVAFLATGVGVTFADSLSRFDFSHLTWGNLWSGLGVGLLSGVLTYVVRNEGTRLGLSPELIAAIQRVLSERLGVTENLLGHQIASTSQNLVGHVNSLSGNLSSHVTEQVETLRPKKAVRGPGGKFQSASPYPSSSIMDPGHD